VWSNNRREPKTLPKPQEEERTAENVTEKTSDTLKAIYKSVVMKKKINSYL
jgi:hypothetical protein